MRKLVITIFLFFAFLTVIVGKADAMAIDSQFVTDKIKSDIKSQIKNLVSGDVSVEVGRIPYSSEKIPDGNLEIVTTTNLKNFTSLIVARVSVLVDKKEVRTFGIPVKVNIFDNVWVAKDLIKRGEAISSSNVSLERKDISLIAENVVRGDSFIQGNIAGKTFMPGNIIDQRFIEGSPMIVKNSLVSIIFQTSNITVTLSGEALDNGKMGDFIKVRNKQYGKDYTGKVVGLNTILVSI